MTMSRTYHIQAPSAAAALAMSEVINSEGYFATYINSDKGPMTLALCPCGVKDAALRTLGLDTPSAR
jgi:hypothetical protein